MKKEAEPVQNELIRLLPSVETDENLAVEVSKVGDVYFVNLIQYNGVVASAAQCENLAVVFATIAAFLVEKFSTKYTIER